MKLSFLIPCTWPLVPRETFKTILNMERPVGMDIEYRVSSVQPLDYNRNDSVERAVIDARADYVFFADADQTFPENTLTDLLESCSEEFPVVTGVYYRKTHPHYTVIGKYVPWAENMESVRPSLKMNGFLTETGEQCLFFRPVDTINTKEPFQVDVFGMGCVLVRADVFKRLRQPYFRYVNGYMTGDHSIGRVSEDMAFCASLKKAGIKALCDPLVQCGHISERIITIEDAVLIEEGKLHVHV